MKQRMIAMVGRPNVGKSALFNRIAGRRIAIVHEEEGTTRDRLVADVEWHGRRFRLVDTGGVAGPWSEGKAGSIDALVRAQAKTAVEEAAVVIMVTDVSRGVVGLDEEVAGMLRRAGASVLLAANKADNDTVEAGTADFARFGFPIFPVSALHNRGVGELVEAAIRHLPAEEGEVPWGAPKVVVVGRPNVGKSSYVNRLLDEGRLIVSDQPGTTRDSIEVPCRLGRGADTMPCVLIDTAGIRQRGKISSSVEHFSVFRAETSISAAEVVVLVTDASQGFTAQDKKIAALVSQHAKGCVLLVNKWDLATVRQEEFRESVNYATRGLDPLPMVFVSTKTGYGIGRSVETIREVAGRVRSQLPTGRLNRALEKACEAQQASIVHGKRLKVYYGTQIGVSPIRIVLFVNDPRIITPAYKRHLVLAVRNAFSLDGAPVLLLLRRRPSKEGYIPPAHRSTRGAAAD